MASVDKRKLKLGAILHKKIVLIFILLFVIILASIVVLINNKDKDRSKVNIGGKHEDEYYFKSIEEVKKSKGNNDLLKEPSYLPAGVKLQEIVVEDDFHLVDFKYTYQNKGKFDIYLDKPTNVNHKLDNIINIDTYDTNSAEKPDPHKIITIKEADVVRPTFDIGISLKYYDKIDHKNNSDDSELIKIIQSIK